MPKNNIYLVIKNQYNNLLIYLDNFYNIRNYYAQTFLSSLITKIIKYNNEINLREIKLVLNFLFIKF
jgi:hypothetical protein